MAQKINFMSFMVKIDRLAAWVLFFTILCYAITGYGMTKGIIDASFSRNLHLSWLGIFGLIAFIIHTSWAIRLFFVRHRWWNAVTKICLPLFYILVVLFFGYLHFFYTPTFGNTNSSTISATTKVFTVQTLSVYNGLNGQPAYVAVDGVVYDLSSVFVNGIHSGFSAGQDLSQIFHSQHPNDLLKGFPIVGEFRAK